MNKLYSRKRIKSYEDKSFDCSKNIMFLPISINIKLIKYISKLQYKKYHNMKNTLNSSFSQILFRFTPFLWNSKFIFIWNYNLSTPLNEVFLFLESSSRPDGKIPRDIASLPGQAKIYNRILDPHMKNCTISY